MYIVEKSDGSEADRWNNLTNPNWPDGASTSGRLKPADMVREGEDGETYTVKEVVQNIEGEGPRTLGTEAVQKVGDDWVQVTKMGPALPPPSDRQGADAKGAGYDPSVGHLYEKWKALVELRWPNGRTARLDIAHDHVGASQFHPLHGQVRQARFN